MTAKRLTWNPKRLGLKKSSHGPHENDVWLYLRGTALDIVIQTNLNGVVLGSTVYRVRLPRRVPASAVRGDAK